jgi:threonine aldolase
LSSFIFEYAATIHEDMKTVNFASDNNAPVTPKTLEAWSRISGFHSTAYGDDSITQEAKKRICDWLEVEADIYFVTGGTAANCLAISSSLRSYHSVVCHQWAHLQTDECHAPGFFKSGLQLAPVGGNDAKIDPAQIQPVVDAAHGIHGTKPSMLSLTQSTEAGTVYTLAEIQELSSVAKNHGMLVHMDGARFCNALVTLKCSPAEMSWKLGVDFLSLGGVKNGLGFGEALVVFNKDRADRLDYRIKQSGQLQSKMRYLAAPWIDYIESEDWRNNATQANRMARILASKIESLEGVTIIFSVEANAVFCRMEPRVYEALLNYGWEFYPFSVMGCYRLMCSWDTTEAAIEAFVNDLKQVL